MPLKAIGSYHKIKGGKLVGSAVDRIRNMGQDDIRNMREFKCCPRCINKVLKDKNARCERCIKAEGRMKKAYSTEMFEALVKGQKIAVFCSMINKIKFQHGQEIIWSFEERAKHQASLGEMEHFCNSNSEEKEQVHLSFDKDMNIIGTRRLENVFQLKQRYLIKII